ncbi:hypothetical protein QJ854_gp492 [Moumouvirus goulette]|uniref:Uncharacterized protein n=1 Tax=Moumouvirus goulette TaxID=1247379 RepID=M1NMM0_9VIRU|nr:hypothetical protein QJ854_gp492 [Moumouvirus goulette]AGF85290.1 hypothetical protein glt_00481 [Moumouvirus goulette]
MSQNLSDICHKFDKFLNVCFSGPIEIIGIVDEIDVTNKIFNLGEIENDVLKKIKCKYDNLHEEINVGQKVVVCGTIVIGENSISNIYFDVDEIFTNDSFNFERKLNKHKKYYNALTTKKEFKRKINKNIYSVESPKNIKNIGIIAFKNHKNDFINLLNNGCVGNVYVYYISEHNIELMLISGLEYFKKYHNIDIIYLLNDNISIKDVCNLSTTLITKFFLNRKEFPYIVSILPSDYSLSNVKPLSAILSNTCFYDNESAFNLIKNTQTSYSNKIITAHENSIQILRNILEKKKKKLEKLKIFAIKIYGPQLYENKNTDEKFSLLKSLLTGHLKDKLVKLQDLQLKITKKIIDDKNFQEIYAVLIKNEVSAFAKKTLIQNPHFQMNPQKINDEVNRHNYILGELKNFEDDSKKIDLSSGNININSSNNNINNGDQV